MPESQQYPPQNPTAPREPAYGEVKETEELASADIGEEEAPIEAAPLQTPEEAMYPPTEATEQGPAKNIIGVLPPENFAESFTGQPTLSPMEQTAKTILAIPGMDPSVRGLAMMILRPRSPGPGWAVGEPPPEPPEGEYDTTVLGE